MLHELSSDRYDLVKDIFLEVDFQLSAAAVINHNNPGIIFVDDVKKPTSAFMKAPEGYLIAGEPNNQLFLKSVKEFFDNIIYPHKMGSDDESWDIYYDPKWETALRQILQGRYPMRHPRMYYLATELISDNWRNNISDEYQLIKIDKHFLQRTSLKNFGEVRSRIDEWGTDDNFFDKGFGFCLIHNNVIVSRCIADCVSSSRVEIGIGTDNDYRKKGFGMTTVLATLDYCFKSGFNQVGWHCSAFNLASQKTAIKAGFNKVIDYFSLWAKFDEFANTISNVYHHLYQERDIITAQDFMLKALIMGDIELQHWYGWARGFALCGNLDKTIECMEQAIMSGWNNVEALIKDSYFDYLPISKTELLNHLKL